MLLDMDRDTNIDFLGKKVSIFCRTHIAVGHRIQGGRPGPLWLRSVAEYSNRIGRFSLGLKKKGGNKQKGKGRGDKK